jgi:hypothetical protein
MMAMFNNKKLFILANIMFASIFSYNGFAQYENSYYSKFGVNISSDYIKAENEQNAVQYEYKNVYTYNFGINYKLLLRKNSDIVFSAQLRNYNMIGM